MLLPLILGLICVVLVYILYTKFYTTKHVAEDLTALQKQLDDANATLYGASWCHYTLKQQKELEDLKLRVPYIECSGKNKKNCPEIEGFPTWKLRDKTFPGYMDKDTLLNFFVEA